ncbi:MAG: TonB family protein [Candidatus Krumholzibacteria bacterium]|nr:TonB family protein [Candidatus Krumholzibacteria bacterium]
MLSRGLPVSILVHAIALVVVFMFGNYVARNPVRPARSIKVKMIHMPPPRIVEKTVPEEPAVQPEPRKEVKTELPPKELPKPKPVEKPKVEKKPQEKIEVEDPKPREQTETPEKTVEKVAKPVISGPSAANTDTDFPFAWYLSRVEGLIARNWDPKQIGFGKRAVVSCAVHFSIARNGTVTQVTLVRNSGVGVFDRESLRAVQTTKLPPLPPQFTGPSLGVTFIFNLEPGT